MKGLLLFSWAGLLVACNYTDIPPDYDSVSYDGDISKEYAFEFMNYHFEPSFLGQLDSTSSASTNAELVVINDSLEHFFVMDERVAVPGSRRTRYGFIYPDQMVLLDMG